MIKTKKKLEDYFESDRSVVRTCFNRTKRNIFRKNNYSEILKFLVMVVSHLFYRRKRNFSQPIINVVSPIFDFIKSLPQLYIAAMFLVVCSTTCADDSEKI